MSRRDFHPHHSHKRHPTIIIFFIPIIFIASPHRHRHFIIIVSLDFSNFQNQQRQTLCTLMKYQIFDINDPKSFHGNAEDDVLIFPNLLQRSEFKRSHATALWR